MLKVSSVFKKTNFCELVFKSTHWFFSLKKNWFFYNKLLFLFKNFILSKSLFFFFWEIPKNNRNKRTKPNLVFFKKSFYVLVFKVLKKKIKLNSLKLRFFFINRFFFIFFKKEWVLLRKKRQSLSFFVKKRKLKVNIGVLKNKLALRLSFFLKKKNKQLFNYNLGFSLIDSC